MDALEILGIVIPKGRQAGIVAGLERTIAKNKGVEFGSLLHMLGTQLTEDPYGKKTHEILLKINKDCTASLPVKPSQKSAAVGEKEAANSKKSKTATKKKAVPKKKKAAPANRSKEKESRSKEKESRSKEKPLKEKESRSKEKIHVLRSH